MPQNFDYYGADGENGNIDVNAGSMLVIAINTVNASVNWADYDWNGDNEVEQIYFIYAGGGQATGAGSKQTITIAIDNISNFVGAQMDIELPAGVTIASESGVVSHDFISGTVNSKHRVLLSSLDNETFSNEELVTLNVEVSGDYKGGSVLISNAIFSDAEGKQYILGGAETGEATGIVELTLGEKVANKIFSVGGQLLDGMKKGINIIMNADGTTKKVLKK